MPLLIDNSTSTAAGAALTLHAPGTYKLLASIPSGDAASIALEERMAAGAEWVPVADLEGNAIALTRTRPSAVMLVGAGQQVRATRSGGAAAVSAWIERASV